MTQVAPTPDETATRRLLGEQIERNRTFTVLIAVAAVLNAGIAAWVVGSFAGGVGALLCLLLIAAAIGAAWVFADRDTRVSGMSTSLIGWAVVVCGAVGVVAALIVGIGAAVADDDDSGFGWLFAFGCLVTAAVAVVMGMLWFALARGAHLALSRQREWMADATAARVTGDPESLCQALEKIERNPELEAGGALVKSQLIMAGRSDRHWWRDLMSSHPSTDRRIARLRLLSQGEGPAEVAVLRASRSAGSLVIAVVLVLLSACGGPAPTASPADGDGSPVPTSSQQPTTAATPSTSSGSIANPTPVQPASVLYQSNWSAGLDGWSGSEDWSALRGELLCAGKLFSLDVGVIAPLDVDTTGDFAVEADIRLLRYAISNGSFGVMVRVQGNGHGYAVGHEASRDLVVLTAQAGGRPLDKQPFTPGEGWHRYRIEVRGNALRAFVDGASVLSATDNTFLTGKRVGLWSSGAQLSVRSFEVTTL